MYCIDCTTTIIVRLQQHKFFYYYATVRTYLHTSVSAFICNRLTVRRMSYVQLLPNRYIGSRTITVQSVCRAENQSSPSITVLLIKLIN